MISLGVIGLLHALLLPGLAVILWVAKERDYTWWDKLLLATPLSISINYACVTVLAWFSSYTSSALYVIFFLECAAILLYAITRINKYDPSARKNFTCQRSSVIDLNLTLLLQGAALFWLFDIYLKTSGTVFDDWDSIVSWNRWAEAWFAQTPEASYGYPPGLPILFSLVYKFSGTDEVQSMAKHVAMFFPFFGLFCVWRAAPLISNRSLSGAIAGIIYVFLILRGRDYPEFVMSGYADPVIASLSAFCLYFLCLAKENLRKLRPLPENAADFFVMVLCISAPALIKQNGVIMAAVLLCCIMLLYRNSLVENKSKYLIFALLVGVVSIHWYVYSYFYWNDFVSAVSLLDVDILKRLRKAIKLTLSVLGYPISIACFIGVLCSRSGRLLAGFYFFPLWLFWAIFVSYDFRSAYYIFPVAALVSVAGIENLDLRALFNWIYDSLVLRVVVCISWTLVAGLFCGAILILPRLYSDEWLIKQNYERRVNSYDPGFNAELNTIFRASTQNQKLVSCFTPAMKLPELKGKFVGSDCSGREHQEWIKRPDVKFFLFYSGYVLKADSVRRDAKMAGLDFEEKELANNYILFIKI